MPGPRDTGLLRRERQIMAEKTLAALVGGEGSTLPAEQLERIASLIDAARRGKEGAS